MGNTFRKTKTGDSERRAFLQVSVAVATSTAIGARYGRLSYAAALTRAQRDQMTAEQIIVSAGAKQSLFNLFMSMLDEGDEVVVPTPAWVSYTDLVQMAGGVARLLPTDPARHVWADDWSAMEPGIRRLML